MVIVSETSTTLITSGLSNEGTVVAKEGAEAKTEGGQDLQNTYLVTVVDPGNGNIFTVKAGNIEIKSNDKVADKTILTVQAIGSTLHVYFPKAETISVYTLSGLLYEQQDVSAGSVQIHLSKGMYLVKIGEKTYKIVIR